MNTPDPEEKAPRAVVNFSDAEGIGLFDILDTWWRQRVKIVLLTAAGLVLMAGALAVIYPLRPSQQQSSVVFRVLFKGAEKGLYPNGMPFTPSDVVATPVLEEVYRRNQMDKFSKFDDFKAAFAVININPAIERLRREYAGQLDNQKLTQVERQKLETEYDNRMKALQNGEFTLVLQQNGSLSTLPATVAGKIIEDILSVWVDQSRTRGVYKFDLSIFSTNILDEITGSTSDYTIQLDRIRLTINRVLANLDLLETIPGARLVRVGDKQVSLGELQAALHDDQAFELREITSIIFSFGLFREPVFTEAYLKEQLFRLDLQRKEILSRNDGMQEVLANYSTGRSGTASATPTSSTGNQGGSGLMPQLSDGFLDRIITMSGQGADTQFRQEISRQIIQNEKDMYAIESDRQVYQRSLDALARGNVATTISGTNVKNVVDEKVAALIAKLRGSLQNVALLHTELSSRNLQPSQVYTIVVPLQQERVSTLSMHSLVVILGLIWCTYIGAVMLFLARKVLE